jgi:RNA polymerase sigma-70 factor, ECF subfamily
LLRLIVSVLYRTLNTGSGAIVPEAGSITSLLIRLHSEDAGERSRAASELVFRYTPELLALITGRMQQRLQQRLAPEDILQEVFLSFCARQQRGEFDLANRDQFLSLIVTIALNKICSAARRELRQRRDVRRERPLESGSDERPGIDPEDYRAAPDVATEIAEEVESLVGRLPPECREVVLLRLEGQTVEEIARKIDRTPRTVERRLERVRGMWDNEMSEG